MDKKEYIENRKELMDKDSNYERDYIEITNYIESEYKFEDSKIEKLSDNDYQYMMFKLTDMSKEKGLVYLNAEYAEMSSYVVDKIKIKDCIIEIEKDLENKNKKEIEMLLNKKSEKKEIKLKK